MHNTIDQVLLPHVGWMRYETGDAVAKFLRQGWFESEEQAFLWLYLRDGDVVVDCGAHAGMFSVLGGKLVSPTGRVVSIEPSPPTARLLRENLAEHGLAGISTVFECAAGTGAGTISLVDEGAGKSAYNRVEAGPGGSAASAGITVRVDSLEKLLASAGITGRVDFLKMDVEGAELDVWAGARPLVERGTLPVVMVEFTEANLRRAGHRSEELYRTIEGAGYALHRLDPGSGQLVRRPLDGPIWYENLFAVRDVGAVNARLREASADRRRVAWDLVQRGIAGAAAREADERAAREERAVQEAEQSAALAARLTAERDVIRKEYEARGEEVRDLAEQFTQTHSALEEARRTIGRLTIDRDEARQTVDRLQAEQGAVTADRQAARARVEDLTRQLRKAQVEAARNQERLRSFCVSKYERLSWALGIRPRPAWIDEVMGGGGGDAPPRRS